MKHNTGREAILNWSKYFWLKSISVNTNWKLHFFCVLEVVCLVHFSSLPRIHAGNVDWTCQKSYSASCAVLFSLHILAVLWKNTFYNSSLLIWEVVPCFFILLSYHLSSNIFVLSSALRYYWARWDPCRLILQYCHQYKAYNFSCFLDDVHKK